MRGKPRLFVVIYLVRRITPAHAGKTGLPCPALPPVADHPRACGENLLGVMELYAKDGSPPRMRGKPVCGARNGNGARITPAHAGKTSVHTQSTMSPADHPRACGENGTEGSGKKLPSGSPPRMRGKLMSRFRALSPARITPAHAGKTSSRIPTWPSQPDHPRACGENRAIAARVRILRGSPPRMRGKRPCGRHRKRRIRITPAHAGKTRCGQRKERGQPDHPRACGENWR